MYDNNALDDLAGTYIKRLIDSLKSEGALTSLLVEDAFMRVPRHAFIDYYYVHDATSTEAEQWRRIERPVGGDVTAWLEGIYANVPLVTAFDEAAMPCSSSSAPNIMAFMLEALQLRPGMRVLEIGTGTGYNAALLAHIVGVPQLVFSIELEFSLAYSAQQKLDSVVGRGTTVHAGNGLHGYNPGAPYDRIIATGSYHKVPLSWLDQLKKGGVLVMNLGRDRATAMGILRLEKIGPKREARGKFLSPAAFLQLREPGEAPGIDAMSQFSRYAHRPAAAKLSISRAEFDPTLLMNMQFAFLVSCELPYASLMWMPKQDDIPFTLNLIDTNSETIVQFRATEQAGVWEVQVKGAVPTWERLRLAYQRWVSLGCPKMTDYVFEVDDEGGQLIRIPGAISGGQSPTWVID
jgi:protein-L-isoaspartate(D-aspartate) O-methyltransferase